MENHLSFLNPVLIVKIAASTYNVLMLFTVEDCANEDGATLDYDSRMLLQFCKAHTRLVDTFVSLEKFNSSPLVNPHVVTNQVTCCHFQCLIFDHLAAIYLQKVLCLVLFSYTCI